MGGWRCYILPRNNNRPGILYASDQFFGPIEESPGSDYYSKWSTSSTASKISGILQKNLHCTQLSLIQLGGGIAVGVELQQTKYYSLLRTPGRVILTDTSVGVRTTSQVHSSILMTSPCRYGMLGGFFAISLLPCAWPIMYVSRIPPCCLWRVITSRSPFDSFRKAIPPSKPRKPF